VKLWEPRYKTICGNFIPTDEGYIVRDTDHDFGQYKGYILFALNYPGAARKEHGKAASALYENVVNRGAKMS